MNPLEILRRGDRHVASRYGRAAEASSTKSGDGSPQPFKNEPLADFSRDINRRSMQGALQAARSRLNTSYPLVIGGHRIDAGRWLTSVNPSRPSEIVGRVASATVGQAEAAVDAAYQAFARWRKTPAADRAALLFNTANILRRRRWELAAWEVLETAKPWREADADVAEAIDYCEYYGREMLRLDQPIRRDVPGEENSYFYEPRGVVVTIAPWNFPLAILCGMSAAALAAGNTVIMKPAEQSSVIAAKLMEAFSEGGFPDGVVNYLPGAGEEIGPVLVNHPRVSTIAFTGSRAVGLAIGAEAARVPPGQDHVKRVITEMGGKNAIIVDDDADLDEAVHGIVASAFGYSGQKCSACSRAIVLESAYDALCQRLVEATRSLPIGPADDPGVSVGPVIDEEAQRRIMQTIDRAKGELKLIYQADMADKTAGYFVPPTIFGDVPANHWLAQEEIFGPVLAMIRASDFDQALHIANSTQYALTGGVYSRSPAHLEQARREFYVGNLYLNRKITGALVDRQPFGGLKLSGIGSKAGGPDYLLQFLAPRVVTENTLRHGFAPETSDHPAAKEETQDVSG